MAEGKHQDIIGKHNDRVFAGPVDVVKGTKKVSVWPHTYIGTFFFITSLCSSYSVRNAEREQL